MALTPLLTLSNPVFQGGLGLMVLGAGMAFLRNVPMRLWYFVRRGLWIDVTIDGSDMAFYWVNQWLSLRPETQASNLLRVESRWYDDDHGSRNERRSTLIPGAGEHIVTFEGAKFWLSVTKEGSPAKPKGVGSIMSSLDEYYKPFNLQIRCRKQHRELLHKLLASADQLGSMPDPTRTRIYLPDYATWTLRSVQHIRKADSVVLADGVYEALEVSLRRFEAAKGHYSNWACHIAMDACCMACRAMENLPLY